MSNRQLTVIVGLGKTGFSCAQFFSERKQPFAVIDCQKQPSKLKKFVQSYPHIELVLGRFSENLLHKAEQIVLSPGVSLREPVIVKQAAIGKPIIGDIELFARSVKKPVIAITGSNGKTTVVTILELMMKSAGIDAVVCGNIGKPALQTIHLNPDYYILELSSFQLETTFSLRSYAATILNISRDHMDRYINPLEYIQTKKRIYNFCQIPIVNSDELRICENFHQDGLSFGLQNQADFSSKEDNGRSFITYRGQKLLSVKELKLNARHHVQNALAALAIGTAAKIPMDTMLKVLRGFTGIRHRCQWVRKYKGVDYYNDSKGTNIGATQAAITSLGSTSKKKLILIAGGDSKGADFFTLRSIIARYVKQIVLIGKDASKLERALYDCTKTSQASSMEEAVRLSVDVAKSGDIVLLSPACASYDMFEHYAHRGNVFIKIVKEL
ncbi:UDP-N-acetylmuramoyl-L-alanine--D-glutamate ligase [Coxiella endosymbiont of Amblyomma sculptum]|uniref:UDP-N-acetylmuramoyl-L-alanine--D-glutamate ligase n=1 Tax=Coxiella endosymbiont of Amblyomma sculptum TaxID=2487929 RepID=UPI00132EDA35|nr:UDP-N-acetylmuramoyl-L-alanine--D-glutamate ligase [Coxiella endosymbiont of Amblyomma sculptum]QHG92411.1 UDP-N-acetylmuramoyl-L-alanine--D-glutamate ligase [Coxiella endosymbiont of Amblyomma sculptum]